MLARARESCLARIGTPGDTHHPHCSPRCCWRAPDLFFSGLFGRLAHDSVVVFMDNRYVEGCNHPIVRTDDQGNSFQRRTLRSGTEWEVLKNFPSLEVLKSTLEQYAPNVTVHRWGYYWAATCST
jgi:hypothetical protein